MGLSLAVSRGFPPQWQPPCLCQTFYLSPVAAIATIISASAMAIFSGDIPGCLLRIPGTPASAAYTDEAYAMTKKGQPELALGICLWFSALGGIFGTLSLIILAPPLAEMALNFSTYEYFRANVRDHRGTVITCKSHFIDAFRVAHLIDWH
jgi:TctA family transporter